MYQRTTHPSSVSRVYRLAAFLLLAGLLVGCSTYGDDVKGVLDDVRAENYGAADKIAKETLPSKGRDRLLYFLERGMIAHLDGRYQDSNKLLERAYLVSESLYRTSAEDWLVSAMTHPGNASYKGQLYERIYLHYTKMLNYLMLAQQQKAGSKQEQLLDGARVENRRIQILLDENVFKTGDYRQGKSEQEKSFSKIAKVFRRLNGDPVDPDTLKFRDQAFAHYVMGALYEQYGELDNARISYQRSATLYEEGYTEQYHLDPEVPRLVWRDVVRVMQKAGGYEEVWPHFAKTKLRPNEAAEVQHNPAKAELLLLQHVDLSPQRKVLNMHLEINTDSRQLVIRPVPVGNRKERREQAVWFYLLYADKGVYNLVRDISDGSIFSDEGILFNSQATTLKPVWPLVEDLGLDEVLGNGGIRIAVPYYPFSESPLASVEVSVLSDRGNISRTMIKADSIAMLGLLQQALEAQSELNSAMARETLRNLAVHEAVKDMGSLGILGGKLLTAGTTNADTRNWLTLPHHIRMQRFQLDPGEYRIELSSRSAQGQPIQQTFSVDLKAGEFQILSLRTFLPLKKEH